MPISKSNRSYIARSDRAGKSASAAYREFFQNRHKAQNNKHVEGAIVVYTDGACHPNPGPGGWAIVIVMPDGTVTEYSGNGGHTTNNRMELQAAIAAIEATPQNSAVRIITDSKYVLNGITSWVKNWKRSGWKRKTDEGIKPVLNADLWKRLDGLCANRKIAWQWVKGHNGNQHNERADQLATIAARRAI